MKLMPLKINEKVLEFLSEFFREIFMYSSLRFMTGLIICLSCLSYCAPKAKADDDPFSSWTIENSDGVEIKVYPLPEWSNYEWKTFRIYIENKRSTEFYLADLTLKFEGREHQPHLVGGSDVNRMITGRKKFYGRGTWEPTLKEKDSSDLQWQGIGHGDRTVNTIGGIFWLASSLNYLHEMQKPYSMEKWQEERDGPNMSPVSNGEWNSRRPLQILPALKESRYFAFEMPTVNGIESISVSGSLASGEIVSYKLQRPGTK